MHEVLQVPGTNVKGYRYKEDDGEKNGWRRVSQIWHTSRNYAKCQSSNFKRINLSCPFLFFFFSVLNSN